MPVDNTIHRIHLNDQPVSYRLIPSKKAKRIRMRYLIVDMPAMIEIVHPPDRTIAQIETFLHANAAMIRFNLAIVARTITKPGPRGTLLFRGNRVHVDVQLTQDHQPSRVVLDNDRIVIHCKTASATPPADVLEAWLIAEAQAAMERHVASVGQQVGRTPQSVKVRHMPKKWGLCSDDGNLTFNWRLIMAPDFVMHYLAVHEVVHLAIFNHSRKFWLVVQSRCPRYLEARKWLEAHTPELFRGTVDMCPPA